jgi:hypothetical protein
MEGLYILRAVLVIAAYQDFTGDTAIVIFLEFVVRPFVLDYPDDYLAFKNALLTKSPDVASALIQVREAIGDILKKTIAVNYSERRIEEQLFEIHNFVNQNLDQFVRLVIILNERKHTEHPVVKMMAFTYAKVDELESSRRDSRATSSRRAPARR